MENKTILYISIPLLVISIVIIIIGSVVYNGIIINQTAEKMKLTEDNSNFWASIPGQSDIQMLTEFFFYDMVTPGLIHDAKSEFAERGPYKQQEYLDYSNRVYNTEKTYVNVDATIKTKPYGKSEKRDLNLVNIGGITLWNYKKSQSDSTFLIKYLYKFLFKLKKDYFFTYIQQASNTKANSKEEFKNNILNNVENLSDSQIDKLYNNFISTDNNMFSKSLLMPTTKYDSYFSDLYNLKIEDINTIKSNYNKFIEDLTFNNADDFAIQQWYQLKPLANVSTQEKNSTYICIELGKYTKDNDLSDTVDIPLEKLKKLLEPTEDLSLFNKEVMDNIFKSGAGYIKEKFQFDESTSIAIHEYLNYLLKEKILKKSKSKGVLEISNESQALMYNFIKNSNSVGYDVFMKIITKAAYDTYYSKQDCKASLENKASDLTEETRNKICNLYDIKTMQGLEKLFRAVMYLEASLLTDLGLTPLEKETLTNNKSKLVLDLLVYIKDFSKNYLGKEITENDHWRTIDLAVFSGEVLFFSKYIKDAGYKSLRELNSEKYENLLEFKSFVSSYGYENNLLEDDINNNLNFDGLYSTAFIQSIIADYMNPEFEEKEKISIRSQGFIEYIRYLYINFHLNGYYGNKRSTDDLIKGYEDSLLLHYKSLPVYKGGDMTINPNIKIISSDIDSDKSNNKTNSINKWSFYSGIDDITQIKVFRSVNSNGKDGIITVDKPYSNGKEVTYTAENPWKKEIKLDMTTDGLSFPPNRTNHDDLNVYFNDIKRSAAYEYFKTKRNLTTSMFFFDRYKMKDNFYADENYFSKNQKGLFNATSVSIVPHLPLYVSRRYLKNTKYENTINILNKEANHDIAMDIDDEELYYDSIVDIEPVSGVTIGAVQRFSYNLNIEKDELFTDERAKMVPILHYMRSFNTTRLGSKDHLSILVEELSVSSLITYIGVAFTTMFALLILLMSCKIYVDKKKDNTEVNDNNENSNSNNNNENNDIEIGSNKNRDDKNEQLLD